LEHGVVLHRLHGADKGYTLKANGFFARDGSVSGTATDIRGDALKFTMPNGSTFEVLRCTAPVAWAFVYPHGKASFGYTIPKWLPNGRAGLISPP